MERLTKRIGNLDAVPNFFNLDFVFDTLDEDYKGLRTLMNRLSDIEDILGNEYDLDRLRELVAADLEGRCVVLPAPFGTRLYTICSTRSKYGKRGKCVKPAKMSWYNVLDYTDQFGKTVFLTREEAEAALRKREASQ